MNLIKKFFQKMQEDGFYSSINKTAMWGFTKIGLKGEISKRKEFLSKKINAEFKGMVRYGPLKGFKFVDDSWWGSSDRASMLLGLYEQEVLISIQNTPKKYKNFIDLGAADGYYGIGVLVGGMFDKSYCYEISKEGREVIKKNAALNNVSDKVNIRGLADKQLYKDFSNNELDESVLFIDIEGGEFNLLDKDFFQHFSNSIIYIELHDWFFKDGEEKLQLLKNEAENFFSIQELTTKSRDPSVFKELNELNDDDRWLICSEGRGKLMTWWRLDPLQTNAKPHPAE